MIRILPFDNQDGFTIVHNCVFDNIMPICKPNTWKIVCAVIRKTIGWSSINTSSGRKEKDVISTSQLQILTGIKQRSTIIDAVQDALESGYIIRVPKSDSYEYMLNRKFFIDIDEEKDNSEITPDDASVIITPDGVQKLHQMECNNHTTASVIITHTKERNKVNKEIKLINENENEKEVSGDKPKPQPNGCGGKPSTIKVKPSSTPRNISRVKPVTQGQRIFLGHFNAVGFKNEIQAKTILEVEENYGIERLTAFCKWASQLGLSMGQAITRIENAVKKWEIESKKKSGNGNDKKFITPEEYVKRYG